MGEQNQMPPLVTPNGPWDKGMQEIELSKTLIGIKNGSFISKEMMGFPPKNYGWQMSKDNADSEHQRLFGSINGTYHRLIVSKDCPNDYFAVYGTMVHGVTHKDPPFDPEQPGFDPKKIPKQGYLASSMSLDIQVKTPEGKVWTAGPDTTRGTQSNHWSIGGNLSAMAGVVSGITAGMNFGFGSSFSIPDVQIHKTQRFDGVNWVVNLPSEKNPKAPSYTGAAWDFGVIFEIPKEKEFVMNIKPIINWEFHYIMVKPTPPFTPIDMPQMKAGVDTKTWKQNQQFIHPAFKGDKPDPGNHH